MGVRFLLGLGESGMYPSGVKTVTEWFPMRERSTATGVFNAGANMGAIAAPLLGVWLAENGTAGGLVSSSRAPSAWSGSSSGGRSTALTQGAPPSHA